MDRRKVAEVLMALLCAWLGAVVWFALPRKGEPS